LKFRWGGAIIEEGVYCMQRVLSIKLMFIEYCTVSIIINILLRLHLWATYYEIGECIDFSPTEVISKALMK